MDFSLRWSFGKSRAQGIIIVRPIASILVLVVLDDRGSEVGKGNFKSEYLKVDLSVIWGHVCTHYFRLLSFVRVLVYDWYCPGIRCT